MNHDEPATQENILKAQLAGYAAGLKEGLEQGKAEGMRFAEEDMQSPEMQEKIKKRIFELTTPEMRKSITGDSDTVPTLEQLEQYLRNNFG
jgi:flagellar biosynthesis/type III secretory pathway protein FliH